MIKQIRENIKRNYLSDNNIPWIIGYSGGKDSTTVLQLVIEVLLDLNEENKANRNVYVISSDTLVENPLVLEKTKRSMNNLQKFAKKSKLPLNVEFVYPEYNNTFLTNLIGKGYPSPLQSFRWCTDRIKINPANKYINDKIDDTGEVILLLGTRKEESTSRKTSMEKHEIKGSSLSKHSSIKNAFTYAPIAMLSTDDVWNYLLTTKSPWGDDNLELYNLYASSKEECPLIVDKNTKDKQTCGNSRFGCWTCTVVNEDKSLTGFINDGEKWLRPLLDFRNYIVEIRDVSSKRNLFDRNGNFKYSEVSLKDDEFIIPKKITRKEEIISVNDVLTKEEVLQKIEKENFDPRKKTTIIVNNNKYYKIGTSSFTENTRYKLFCKLLDAEKEIRKTKSDFNIITKEEVKAIRDLWLSDGYYKYNPIEIYNETHEKDEIVIEEEYFNIKLFNKISKKYKVNGSTLYSILHETKKNKYLIKRDSNKTQIQKKLSQHKLLIKEEDVYK